MGNQSNNSAEIVSAELQKPGPLCSLAQQFLPSQTVESLLGCPFGLDTGGANNDSFAAAAPAFGKPPAELPARNQVVKVSPAPNPWASSFLGLNNPFQ